MSITGTGSGADAILTNYTETQFLRFVPEWAPRNPGNNFARAVVSGDTGWSWNLASPDQLTSTPSGTIFPSANYTLQSSPLTVLSGKTVNVPFYVAAGTSSTKSLVLGAISFYKREQLRRFFDALAPAYVQSGITPETRNDAYARRIAIALDAWANYVPDYDMVRVNSPTLVSAEEFSLGTTLGSQIQRASDHNGLAHEWDESELFAFDAIYDSKALADLAIEKGYDVREHIRQGLFFNIGDFFKDRVSVDVAIGGNLSGPYSILAKVARVLNRPDYILWMGDYLDATIRRKILRDGVLPEGIGYSYNYIAENIDASKSTRDYFLTRPFDTTRLEAIFVAANSAVPILEGGIDAWNSTRLHDGILASFGDTNFNAVTARNAGNTALLPAYGHLAFGMGAGTSSVQLNQNFSDDSNHMRSDVTAFTLWANQAELLGNIRYYNSLPGRNFTEQILAYNAVTIDRSNMSRGTWTVGNNNHKFTSGNLTLFEPMNHGISVSEIDGLRPYANRASRYQRLMILNTVDANRPYVVDVFRITGGTTHDYTLHGAITFDQTGKSSFPLTPMPGPYPLLESGETWVEPTSSGSTFPYYGFFRNETQGTAPENFQITYRDNTASKRDVRWWMTGEAGSTVYLGTTPNPSRSNTTPANFYTFSRPSTIVRHRIGSGSLESLYVSVVEPMSNGASTVRAVARVPLVGPNQEAVALRVWFTDGRFDTYLVNLRNPAIAGASGGAETISTADGEYSLTGRVGVYVSRATSESRVWTVGASHFKYGTQTTTNPTPSYSGTIVGMTRKIDGAANDAFIVDSPLAAGTALQGRQLSLTFGDYHVVGSATIQKDISEMFQIDHVEQIEGQTHVVLTTDHQLKMSGSTTAEQVAPERTFTGANTFQIVLATSGATIASPTPTLPPDAPTLDPDPETPPETTTPTKITIPASSVTASATTGAFVAGNTVDGNLSTRWAGNGEGVWIRYDLGQLKMIDYVKAAWFQGTTRTYTFDLQVSTDATTWTTVLAGAKNTTTNALETYDFTDTYGRYVRLVGHRNTVDGYMNVTELEVWADDRPPLPAPTFDPAGGTYEEQQMVAIRSTTPGAKIRYTVDGTTPSRTVGTLYTSSFLVNRGVTEIKAIAYIGDTFDSALASATYEIGDNTAPALTLPAAIVAAATSASGAIVSFTVGAEDNFDDAVSAIATPASGSVFPIGTTTVNVTATDSAGNQAAGSFTVTITSSYASWADMNGLTASNNSFNADVDGDGIVNLLEYFLGLRPTVSDPLGLPTGTIEGDEFVFRFNRAKGVTNATHRVLVSSDLVTWSPVASEPVLESENDFFETFVVKLPQTSPKMFARLEVTAR